MFRCAPSGRSRRFSVVFTRSPLHWLGQNGLQFSAAAFQKALRESGQPTVILVLAQITYQAWAVLSRPIVDSSGLPFPLVILCVRRCPEPLPLNKFTFL